MRYYSWITRFYFFYCKTTKKQIAMYRNPLLDNWASPHQTPPFSLFRNEHYAPAVREAIIETEKNVDRIVAQNEAPTFENTIEQLELASEKLDSIVAIMMNLNECNTNPEMQETVLELMPEITRHENGIWMNRKLFERVKTLRNNWLFQGRVLYSENIGRGILAPVKGLRRIRDARAKRTPSRSTYRTRIQVSD